jgi:hypothetical protein
VFSKSRIWPDLAPALEHRLAVDIDGRGVRKKGWVRAFFKRDWRPRQLLVDGRPQRQQDNHPAERRQGDDANHRRARRKGSLTAWFGSERRSGMLTSVNSKHDATTFKSIEGDPPMPGVKIE